MSLSSQVDAAIQRIGEVVKGKADAADLDAPDLIDGVTEWWCQPVATTIVDPTRRTVFGSIAENGSILACEFNHSTRKTKRYAVGQAVIDDHNAPALWIAPGHRPVIAWTDHSVDNFIKVKVGSQDGDLTSLVNAPLIQVNLGGAASYTQMHRIEHLSSELRDVFWIFTRRGNTAWGFVQLEVDQATGVIWHDPYQPVVSAPSRQCYISVADAHTPDTANQVLRMGWGYNPAQPVHDIYYMEIDVVTGRVSSPVSPSWGTTIGNPITDTATSLPPLIPHNGEGNSRRFFYVRPGPDTAAVAYADWAEATPDEATYHTHELTGSAGITTSGGTLETLSPPSSIGRGFIVETVFTLPTSLTGTYGVVSKYRAGGSDHSFFLRLTKAGDLGFALYDTAGTAHPFHTTNAPMASLMVPGSTTGIRVTVDLDQKTLTRHMRTTIDKWEQIDRIDLSGAAHSALISSGLGVSDAPVRAPFAPGATSGGIRLRKLILSSRTGATLLGGFDLGRGEWRNGYDMRGNRWVLNNGPSVNVPTWTTSSFGIAGARVGYNASANYVAGMTFENPSSNRVVVTAHTDGTTEAVRRWRVGTSGYESEDAYTQPTSESRIIRPVVPINESAVDSITVNSIHRYGATFRDYLGDIINLR